jgi:hypothetical protein
MSLKLEEALPILRQGGKVTHETIPNKYITKFGEGTANETFIIVEGKQINTFHFSHISNEAIWDNKWSEYKEPAQQ